MAYRYNLTIITWPRVLNKKNLIVAFFIDVKISLIHFSQIILIEKIMKLRIDNDLI